MVMSLTDEYTSIEQLCVDTLQRLTEVSGRSERGFQRLAKVPAQFELKTKKKVINLHTQQCVMHFDCIISNRTTVIKVSRSDCSIRVFNC